ncbi:hypothetical protein H310_03187 [Aphanomyces invadans]|uniref:Uncharacterized protein n=1 Tax=Aphanomyces invadans TaxID=157072 RepID=A0A024UGB2_9STRA|nr:hypothetical protein H310_03187 [Aphanomyces invadans]ETW05421.1 hypothetical protein H310_03187 [Aphanomyces invadans]RHY27915.1 hypothetical protein DYB32_006436 [Aphanomyces invadans]|eukprot:XP_008865198.1 hypothetical protein H310_03187 [Aphanomyces invadans]
MQRSNSLTDATPPSRASPWRRYSTPLPEPVGNDGIDPDALQGRCRSLTQERDLLRERLLEKAMREAEHEMMIQGLQDQLAKLTVLSVKRQSRYEELLQAYQEFKKAAMSEIHDDV